MVMVEPTITTIHGLAATIRSSTESETFDLGGLSASTIATVVEDAFSSPFLLKEMIRITLVVGAGKANRQKYDAQALKVVTSTLQNLCGGFVEERGSSCVVDCAGMYKFQHDTGKNLKTVVIFPKIKPIGGGGGDDDSDAAATAGSLFAPNSMEYKIAVSSMAVFQNMVTAKCPTWSEKKALSQFIDDKIDSHIQECDELLIRGQPLSVAQQAFYDSCTELSVKQAFVKQAMHTQIDQGQVTQFEVDQLVAQIQHRMDELKATTTMDGKHNKSTTTTPPITKAQLERRQTKLQLIVPIPPAKLKHHAALGKLWKQVQPLIHLKEDSGKLLSVHDAKLLGQKIECLDNIDHLEEASRGWLEAEDIFQERLTACRRELQGKYNSSNSGKKKGNSSNTATISSSTKVRVPITKWVTPGMKHSGQAAAAGKKKSKAKKGDVFGAMMANYDDSDDEDDEEEEEETTTEQQTVEDENKSSTTSSVAKAQNSPKKDESSTNKSSSGSKKKKNKRKGKSKSIDDDLDLLVADPKKEEEEETTALSTLISIVQNFLWPVFVAFLGWLIALLFGKAKKKKKE